MRRTAWHAIALICWMAAPGWAQDVKDGAPPARAEVGVGRPGAGIDQLGLGVGVDPKGYTKSELLAVPGVLDELQVTDEQRERLKVAAGQAKRDANRIYEKIQGGKAQLKAQGEEDAELAMHRQALGYVKQLTRDFEKPVLKVLDAKQAKRLEQIQVRADGFLAFDLPDVTGKLGLTPDQEAAIAECVKAGRTSTRVAAFPYRQAAAESAGRPEGERKAARESTASLGIAERAQAGVLAARAETLREIRKVLTTAQQATYRNMLGPPFDFARLDPVRQLKQAAAPGPDEFDDRKP